MKAEECGIVTVKGQRRYTVKHRRIERGKRKGQIEALLVSGHKVVVEPGHVIREHPPSLKL